MSKTKNIAVEIENANSLTQLLASGDFNELDSELKGQVINYTQQKYLVEVGYMGKLLGTKNTGIHVAFLLCIGFLIIILVDMIHGYYVGNNVNMDFISLVLPFFTLSLGYIFGKGQSSD